MSHYGSKRSGWELKNWRVVCLRMLSYRDVKPGSTRGIMGTCVLLFSAQEKSLRGLESMIEILFSCRQYIKTNNEIYIKLHLNGFPFIQA